MSIGDVTGTITIEAVDGGGLTPTPRVSFSPVGNITSGWLDKHAPYIHQQIEHEQARVRRGVSSDAPTTDTTPRRRR